MHCSCNERGSCGAQADLELCVPEDALGLDFLPSSLGAGMQVCATTLFVFETGSQHSPGWCGPGRVDQGSLSVCEHSSCHSSSSLLMSSLPVHIPRLLYSAGLFGCLQSFTLELGDIHQSGLTFRRLLLSRHNS